MRGKHLSSYKILPVYSNSTALRNFKKLKHSKIRGQLCSGTSSSVSCRECSHRHSAIIDTFS